MTDIHDIRPVLPPDFRPLIIGLVILAFILGLLLWQILIYIKKKRGDKKEPLFVVGFKELALKELHTIREQLEHTEEPNVSYFASRLHQAVKWYLSNKLQKTITAGTLTELLTYIPQTFSPILTFCYSVIYPWQKRTRMEIVAFIDTSIETIKNDI